MVFRDKDGAASCIRDECAHRACPLSLGTLENGEIACAYHGWAFDGEGKCTKMPSTTFRPGLFIRISTFWVSDHHLCSMPLGGGTAASAGGAKWAGGTAILECGMCVSTVASGRVTTKFGTGATCGPERRARLRAAGRAEGGHVHMRTAFPVACLQTSVLIHSVSVKGMDSFGSGLVTVSRMQNSPITPARLKVHRVGDHLCHSFARQSRPLSSLASGNIQHSDCTQMLVEP